MNILRQMNVLRPRHVTPPTNNSLSIPTHREVLPLLPAAVRVRVVVERLPVGSVAV